MKHVENAGPKTPALRDAKAPWKSGIVMVCRECDGSSKRLRRALKDALNEIDARKRVRVVGCNCLDLCPKRATAVVTAGFGPVRCTIVREDAEPSALRPIVERFEIADAGMLTSKIVTSKERL